MSALRDHLLRTRLEQAEIDAANARAARDEARAEAGRLREALKAIEETARWYADNGQRLPLEVDHALCVEVLDCAQRGLAP